MDITKILLEVVSPSTGETVAMGEYTPAGLARVLRNLTESTDQAWLIYTSFIIPSRGERYNGRSGQLEQLPYTITALSSPETMEVL